MRNNKKLKKKKNRSDKIIMYYNSVNKVKLCFTTLK